MRAQIAGWGTPRQFSCTYIDFRAQTDTVLSNHLEYSPRNARYLFSGIQNELIQVCGETIRESLVHDCRLAQFFSV